MVALYWGVPLETADSPRNAASRPASNGGSGGLRRGLDVYLRRAGRNDRMTAAEEHEALRELFELRALRWKTLLSTPLVGEPLATWLASQVDDADLDASLAALRERTGDEDSADDVLDVAAMALARAARGRGEKLFQAVLRWAGDDGVCDGELPLPLRGTLDADSLAAFAHSLSTCQRAYVRARNRFVASNLRLVVSVAGRFSNDRMSIADRVQEGNLGLIDATERFDPEKGNRFSTYAVWWIRHHITRALVYRGRKVRIPANLHRTFMKARRAEPGVRARLGREPTVDEIAAEIDVSEDKLADAREAMELRGISLETRTDDGEGRTLADVLEAPPTPDVAEHLDESRHLAAAREAFEDLDPKARDILRHRYGLEGAEICTLRSLGERYSLSRERIRQLQKAALLELRQAIAPELAAA